MTNRRRTQNATHATPSTVAQKPQQTNTKTPQKPKTKKKSRNPQDAVTRGHIVTACGITNPFCSAALSAKYPDASNTRTLRITSHSRFTVTNNASGNSGTLFCPGYDYLYAADPVVTTPGTCLFTNLLAPAGLSTFAPSGYRLVSAGVVIRPIVPSTSAGGMIRLRGFSTKWGAGLGSLSGTAYTSDFFADYPVLGTKSICVTFKRTEQTTATTFIVPSTTNPSAAVTAWVAPGWNSLLIYIDGGQPSVASIDMEYVFHYELSFGDGDGMAYIATPAHPQDDLAQSAADYASTKLGQIFEASMDAMTQRIENVISGYIVDGRRRLN